MSNPYRDVGLPPCREPMFMEVALKRAKEKLYMTQEQRTEAAIEAARGLTHRGYQVQALENHSSDLARKYDALKDRATRMAERAARGEVPTLDEIRAITESE